LVRPDMGMIENKLMCKIGIAMNKSEYFAITLLVEMSIYI